MTNKNVLKKLQKNSGIILFLVIGAIFVLTILVLSYNYLVNGKFNEQRGILKHVRCMKCAQGITRFVINKLRYELKQPISSSSGISKLLKSKILLENDPAKLADKMNSEWLTKVNYLDLLKEMLPNHLRKDASINVSVSFKDIISLKSLKKGNELFFDFEKAGNMIINTVIQIGKTREAWSEIRPFRVIVPYPTPITKFSLYLPKATTALNPTKFNTVSITSAASGNISTKSPSPLCLYNTSLQEKLGNKDKDIWKQRGWIYMGGGNIQLNRAASHQEHGQRYFSYFPGANHPIALLLKFTPQPNIPAVNGHSMDFRMARWGFSESLLSGTNSGMWKKILNEHLKALPKTSWWKSTCLHLFGDADNRSITRVCGNVYDRFLELGYLVPSGGGNPPIGAIIGIPSEEKFKKYSGNARNMLPTNVKDVTKTLRKNVFMDSLVYLPVSPKTVVGVDNVDDMKDFFKALPYLTKGEGISFNKIMSKPDYCKYDETYKMISQYEQNSQTIGIPPSGNILEVDNMNFGMEIPGLDTKNLQINKISNDLETSMEKRVCYEIDTSDPEVKDAFKLLEDNFCRKPTRDLNLQNSVVKIKTNGKILNLANDLGTHTGGTIISDGPIKIGTFRSNIAQEYKSPLVFIAKKGAITVNNNINNSTLGYLIALGKQSGEIKPLYPNKPLNIVGGIAASTLDPSNIFGGGQIKYNSNLDPTSPSFADCIGCAFGPAGGINEK